MYLDGVTEMAVSTALDGLDQQMIDDPLAALAVITRMRRELAEREKRAVFRALETHSWREVGDALGVSKQAAFQRFGRDWVQTAHATLPPTELRRTIEDRLER
jgi:hypothetical protein